MENAQQPHIPSQATRSVKWVPSERGSLKLNVDCSWVQEEFLSSVAGILRDSTGRVVDGFVREVGASSPLQAEALAVLQGLEVWKLKKAKRV